MRESSQSGGLIPFKTSVFLNRSYPHFPWAPLPCLKPTSLLNLLFFRWIKLDGFSWVLESGRLIFGILILLGSTYTPQTQPPDIFMSWAPVFTWEGRENEGRSFLSICGMLYGVLDVPSVLVTDFSCDALYRWLVHWWVVSIGGQ